MSWRRNSSARKLSSANCRVLLVSRPFACALERFLAHQSKIKFYGGGTSKTGKDPTSAGMVSHRSGETDFSQPSQSEYASSTSAVSAPPPPPHWTDFSHSTLFH